MKLSIIVPVYNTEEYLPRCLDSLVSQTYDNLEIIVVNDGSKDKSGEIAKQYAEADKRIKVLDIFPNGGVSAARNLGIENATGEYIAFVDSDDYIRENMYESLLRIAEQTQADLISSDIIINGQTLECSLKSNHLYSRKEIEEELMPAFSKSNMISVMAFTNKIIKRKVIEGNGLRFDPEFSYQEDLMFMIQVFANSFSFYYLPQAFYEYYPLSTGLYSAYRTSMGQNFIKAREKMNALIDKYHIQNVDKNNLNAGFLYNVTYFIYRTKKRVKNKKERRLLIYGLLKHHELAKCCQELLPVAASFDRRIAKAIVKGKYRYCLMLISFVYSETCKKVQKLIAKIKGIK